jgi:adenosylmethionine-8-amino-7-oxononanoate aminotransferase
MQQGLLLRPLGNTVYLLPPYVVTEDQLSDAYQKIAAVLKQHKE